jgi:nitrite reductase/ring-hydroxylating ferredoxin subunit
MTTDRGITRRGVLAGAAAVGVGVGVAGMAAACGDGTGGPGGGGGDTGPVSVPVAQIPVGGAAIVGQVVVSQPTQGEFKAFSAICTHEQCIISRVSGDTVECTCHNSLFSTVDGAPLRGPAARPLSERDVTVEGDTLTVS